MNTDFDYLTPIDFINGTYPTFSCIDPLGLAVLEYKEEVVLGSGLILLSHSSQRFGVPEVLPKWRVVAIGKDVTDEIDVKVRDIIIIHHYAGKLRTFGMTDLRYVKTSDVLAKIQYEPSDWIEFAKNVERRVEENRRQNDDYTK